MLRPRDAVRAHVVDTASRCEALAGAGAAVAAACEALLCANGMGEAVAGKTVLQLSTMSPAESVALDGRVRARSGRYLDGGILGYPADVRERTARIVFSGERATFDAMRTIIDSLTALPLHIGERPGTAFVVDKLVYAQFYGIALAWLHTAAMVVAAGVSLADFRAIASGDERWQWKGRTMDGFLDMVEKRDYAQADCTLEAHAAAYEQVAARARYQCGR